MKNLIIVAIFLSFSIKALCQIDIKNEIISFTDSTEILIRNGRRLVAEKTITGDRETAIKTFNYLKENIDDEYLIFYPEEEIILSIANSNFAQFLHTAKNYNSLLEGKTKYAGIEDVIEPVYQFITQEISLIKNDLEISSLNYEEKQLLRIYLSYYEGKDKLESNKAVKKYKKAFPDSEYSAFLEKLDTNTQSYFMNFCLGYGYEFLNGNIANSFSNQFDVMALEVEWFIDQYYFSFLFSGSLSEIYSKHDIIADNYTQTPEDVAFSIKYGIKIGRSWYRTNTFNVFSYLSLGGYQMKPEKSIYTTPYSEYSNLKLTNSFFTGIGTAFDLTIINFKNKTTERKTGSWFIRPNLGYDLFLTNKDIAKGGSFYTYLTTGIGFSR